MDLALAEPTTSGATEASLEVVQVAMDLASLEVREKLDVVELPRDVKRPVMLRFDPSYDPIMRLQLSGDMGLARLRYAADKEIKKNLESTESSPQWVAVRHYGWRSTLISIFPNATSLKPVDGPDVRLIPWFNIVFIVLLVMILATLWRLWLNFRRARIDPVLEDIDEGVDAAQGRAGAFLDRVFGKRR